MAVNLFVAIAMALSIHVFLDQMSHYSVSENYETINAFLNICNSHHLSPILADSDIIEKLETIPNCAGWQVICEDACQLCNMENVFFFVMVKRFRVNWAALENDFQSSGWQLKILYKDEEKRTEPFHLFACSTICNHIAFLYWQTEGFWWHSALDLQDIPTAYPQKPISQRAFLRLDKRKVELHGMEVYIPENLQDFSKDLASSEFKRCNVERAKKFYQRYPKNDTEQDILFRHRSWKVLAATKTVLDNLGIVFWLSSGTFLGYYRQCDIFPYAGDVDIGMWIKDYDANLTRHFKNAGFRLKHIFGETGDSYELSFKYNGIKLDIFFFYEANEFMWNGGTQAKTGIKYKYIFPRFHVCWTVFLELFVHIPCPEEPYLLANYGRNWMVPTSNWDWKASPPNVVFNGYWDLDRWHEVIQVFPG